MEAKNTSEEILTPFILADKVISALKSVNKHNTTEALIESVRDEWEEIFEAYTAQFQQAEQVDIKKVVEVINRLIYQDADNDLKIGFNQGITTIRQHIEALQGNEPQSPQK